MSQIKFFQPADGGEWHAYREESAQALCGEAQLSYNRDRVADEVPTDGALHDGCRQAIEAENPAPYQPSIDPVEESAEATGETSDGEETDTSASDYADAAAAEITNATPDEAADTTDAVPTDDAPADQPPA